MKDTLNGLGSDNGENIHRLLMKIIFITFAFKERRDRCSRGYVNKIMYVYCGNNVVIREKNCIYDAAEWTHDSRRSL